MSNTYPYSTIPVETRPSSSEYVPNQPPENSIGSGNPLTTKPSFSDPAQAAIAQVRSYLRQIAPTATVSTTAFNAAFGEDALK